MNATAPMNAAAPIDYLNPNLPAGLRSVVMPIVEATPAALIGYGYLVDDPEDCRIEIVRWPAQGSRPVDADTGDQGGTTEGVFISAWRGALRGTQRFFDRQGAVHARVSIDFAREFGCLVEAPIPE